MEKFCKNLVERTVKKIINKLRSIYNSEDSTSYVPFIYIKRTDKDAHNGRYPNYKKKHQRHEQNK